MRCWQQNKKRGTGFGFIKTVTITELCLSPKKYLANTFVGMFLPTSVNEQTCLICLKALTDYLKTLVTLYSSASHDELGASQGQLRPPKM